MRQPNSKRTCRLWVRVGPRTDLSVIQLRERDACSAERQQGVCRCDARYVLDSAITLHHSLYWAFLRWTAIASSQVRISETIDIFFGAADRTSDGPMAPNPYPHSTQEQHPSTT